MAGRRAKLFPRPVIFACLAEYTIFGSVIAMTETGRPQYRERIPRPDRQKEQGPHYIKVITLQLLLCVIILLAVLGVKQFGGDAFERFRQSYGQVVGESYTGKLLEDGYQAIEDAIAQTFSFLEHNNEGAGAQDAEPASSIFYRKRVAALAAKRIKPPAGATFSPVTVFGALLYPVEGGTISCLFGYRVHPITGKRDFHTGLDIAAPRGTRIMAAVSGTVTEIRDDKIYGKMIVLDHGANFYTVYCHCERILAQVGARVKSGETIALVGDSGLATGPHLHFEIRKDGLNADPIWVFDRESVNVL